MSHVSWQLHFVVRTALTATKALHADVQACCIAGCGVVPVKHVHLSDWAQDGYGADGWFYNKLSERLPRTYMIPKVLFMYSGAHG